MKVALVYPVPADALETFEPDIRRFTITLDKFDPGHEFGIVPVLSHSTGENFARAGDMAMECFELWGLRDDDIIYYSGKGCDIGSHQHVAHSIDIDLMVCLSTRVHFHKPNWLRRLVETFNAFDCKGIVGPMGSFERQPHLRTCCYGMSPELFRSYPHLINSREKTFEFETGKWCVTKWAADQGLPVRMVTWESSIGQPGWRAGHLQNIYRRGDQSNCLVWDRHTELYAKASPEEKRKLEHYAGDK